MPAFEYKIAQTKSEFEAIHKLNHQTFVDEIPQHQSQKDGKLIDKFHSENTYFICKSGDELVAMVAGRTNRPFSLDHKVERLDELLPANTKPVEVRLLSVDPKYRKTRVCGLLIEKLASHYAAQGQDIALISATDRQLRLYKRMGFESFGPAVGKKGAYYQPMYLTLSKYFSLATLLGNIKRPHKKINLQPGPVDVSVNVSQSLSNQAKSHRSQEFLDDYNRVAQELCELTHMPQCYLLQGSGTLANEAIAGQLKQQSKKGLVIVNGEFGERLITQCKSWQLQFDVIRCEWGKSFDVATISDTLADKEYGWMWFVALETSVGIVNPYRQLIELTERYEVDCCIDAVSLIGTEETNFSGAYLVSGTSSKGLGAYSGIAFVARDNRDFISTHRIPCYLDLQLYAQKQGVPFTLSSNLLDALNTALLETNWHDKFIKIRQASLFLFERFSELNIDIVNKDKATLGSVLTIQVPKDISIKEVAADLLDKGYLLYFEPNYLKERHWVQISLYSIDDVEDIYNLPLMLKESLSLNAQKSRV